MVIPDVQLLVQALLYLTIFFTGFAVSVPVGLFQMNFSGTCMLYADVSWKNASYFTITGSSDINCHFVIYFHVLACIFFALAMFVYYGYAICQKDPDIGSQMWVMPFVLMAALVAVVSFIASCILSVGFKELCDRLADNKNSLSCSQVGSLAVFVQDDYNGKHFYAYLTAAQSAAWIGFLCWSAQCVLGIVRFVRNRRMRSQAYQDSINTSTSDTQKIGDVEPTA